MSAITVYDLYAVHFSSCVFVRYSHSPSCNIGVDADIRFTTQIDSLQVTLVINSAVGCHDFLPGARLPSQLQSITALGRYQFMLLGEQRQMCVKDLTRSLCDNRTAGVRTATGPSPTPCLLGHLALLRSCIYDRCQSSTQRMTTRLQTTWKTCM